MQLKKMIFLNFNTVFIFLFTDKAPGHKDSKLKKLII